MSNPPALRSRVSRFGIKVTEESSLQPRSVVARPQEASCGGWSSPGLPGNGEPVGLGPSRASWQSSSRTTPARRLCLSPRLGSPVPATPALSSLPQSRPSGPRCSLPDGWGLLSSQGSSTLPGDVLQPRCLHPGSPASSQPPNPVQAPCLFRQLCSWLQPACRIRAFPLRRSAPQLRQRGVPASDQRLRGQCRGPSHRSPSLSLPPWCFLPFRKCPLFLAAEALHMLCPQPKHFPWFPAIGLLPGCSLDLVTASRPRSPFPHTSLLSASATLLTPISVSSTQISQPNPVWLKQGVLRERLEPAGPGEVTRPPHHCLCSIFTERALCSQSPGRSSHFLPADPPSGPHTPTPSVGRKRARCVSVTWPACPSTRCPPATYGGEDATVQLALAHRGLPRGHRVIS